MRIFYFLFSTTKFIIHFHQIFRNACRRQPVANVADEPDNETIYTHNAKRVRLQSNTGVRFMITLLHLFESDRFYVTICVKYIQRTLNKVSIHKINSVNSAYST